MPPHPASASSGVDPTANWLRFAARVVRDPELLAELENTPDRDTFAALAVRLGAALGLDFTATEIRHALDLARHTHLFRHVGTPPNLAPPPRLIAETRTPFPPSWTIMRLHRADASAGPSLEWIHFDQRRLQEPFFEQTVTALLGHPARLLFTRHTGFDVLDNFAATAPELAVAGFVFHMSRCGSTLFAQALAADPRHVVLSEPPPIDELLARDAADPALSFERRVVRLRGLVHAYARRRRPEETRLFIKFDAWHTIHLPVIRAAFPRTPWVFLHREPVEVLVSQRRMRGAKFIPGAPDAPPLDGSAPEFTVEGFEKHTARMLGATCDAAIEALTAPGSPGLAVDYRDLRQRLPGLVHGHFGAPDDATGREAIAAALGRNAKNPVLAFEDDTAAKHREADDTLRALAQTHLGPQRRRLLALAEQAPQADSEEVTGAATPAARR